MTSTVGDIFQKEDDKYLCLNVKWNVNPERDSIEEIALKPTSFAISISAGPISLSLDLKSAPMLRGPGWVKCTKLSPHCYSAPPETRDWKPKVKEYCVNVVLRIEFNKHDPSIQVQNQNLDSNAAVFSSLRDLFCMEYCKTGCIHRQTERVNRQSKYVRGFQHIIHCCLEKEKI